VERQRFLPLFILTGASGTGKTAVVDPLRRLLPDWEVFETDILWAADWDQQRGDWLRIAYSIAQSGRATLLCGTLLPADVDRCDHRRFFPAVHYLALTCDDATRAARLRARPAWRGTTDTFIAAQSDLDRWLHEHAGDLFDPPLELVDTSSTPLLSVAEAIRDWAVSRWPAARLR
jgi:hypothetical protein